MTYNPGQARFSQSLLNDDGNDLPTRDIDAVSRVQNILYSDNQALGSKVQSFEREFDKTWERVAVDATGLIAKLPPLFNSLQAKIKSIKQRQQQIDTIMSAASTSQSQHRPSVVGSLVPTTTLSNNRHGVIRSVCLVVDLSESSLEKDIRPTRFDFLLALAGQFIDAFIDQHPLSEIASLTVAQGHCKLRTPVRQPKGDYSQHLRKCQDKTEPKGGVFSIQNTIHSCGHLLQSAPPQSIKEIIIMTCSLNTVDVKDIEDTIAYCSQQDITVNIIGLDARVRIFGRVAATTGGTYEIACDSTQFYTALFHHLKPPIKQKKHTTRGWLQVAFPSVKIATKKDIIIKSTDSSTPITNNTIVSNSNQTTSIGTTVSVSTLICLCHNKLRDRIFVCPTCNASVCQIPNQCPICKTLLLSYPLLARSASQLHIPAPTTPVHFNDKLFPLKDLQNIAVDDDIDQVLRMRRPRVRFKRNQPHGTNPTNGNNPNQSSSSGPQRSDGINYLDDGTSIVRSTADQLVELESMTFAPAMNTAQVLKAIQKYHNQTVIGTKNKHPIHETTTLPPVSTHQSHLNQEHQSGAESFAVQSTTCQSHIVNCLGCTCPLIVPTTKLLETALVYTEDVTNIRICTCPVCRNTDLVTSCTVCGCFLCNDCDKLTQTLLQNCPGCFSSPSS